MMSYGVILIAAVSIVVIVNAIEILYCTLLSPLRKVPSANVTVPFAPLWILWHRWNGTEVFAVKKAHDKYGPIVRIGPREIAVNDVPNGIAIVHGSPGFDKTSWYDFFINYGKRNAFSMTGHKEHSLARKLSNRVYTKSYIYNSAHISKCITEVLFDRFLPLIHRSTQSGESIDILPVNIGYGIDIMTGFTFGMPRGTNLVENAEERTKWINMHSDSHIPLPMFWLLEFPLLSMMISPILPTLISWQKGRNAFEEWAQTRMAACDIALENVKHFESLPVGQAPLLYGQIKSLTMRNHLTSPARAEGFTLTEEAKLDVASEVLDHVHAMRDTFGVSMTYTVYELCRRPSIQQALYNDLKANLPTETFKAFEEFDSHKFMDLATYESVSKQLEALSYLDAVIKEGWRLRNTYPTPNPRVTPPGPNGSNIELCGFKIPRGTRVASYAWVVHRRDDIFTESCIFRPERWIESDTAKLREMERWTWSFGSGNRGCPGQHFGFQSKSGFQSNTPEILQQTCQPSFYQKADR